MLQSIENIGHYTFLGASAGGAIGAAFVLHKASAECQAIGFRVGAVYLGFLSKAPIAQREFYSNCTAEILLPSVVTGLILGGVAGFVYGVGKEVFQRL